VRRIKEMKQHHVAALATAALGGVVVGGLLRAAPGGVLVNKRDLAVLKRSIPHITDKVREDIRRVRPLRKPDEKILEEVAEHVDSYRWTAAAFRRQASEVDDVGTRIQLHTSIDTLTELISELHDCRTRISDGLLAGEQVTYLKVDGDKEKHFLPMLTDTALRAALSTCGEVEITWQGMTRHVTLKRRTEHKKQGEGVVRSASARP
jgi:hypothetical protein